MIEISLKKGSASYKFLLSISIILDKKEQLTLLPKIILKILILESSSITVFTRGDINILKNSLWILSGDNFFNSNLDSSQALIALEENGTLSLP